MLDKIELLSEEWKEEIIKLKKLDRPIILFGAGCTSQFIVDQFREYGIFPEAFCDNNENKIGSMVAGLRIVSVAQLLDEYRTAYIYITTQLYYTEIKNQLCSLGIKQEQISKYDIIFQMEWEKEYIEYCKKRKDELDWLCQNLADDKSRKVLFNRLAFFRTRNREYMTQIRDKNQYFDDEIIDFDDINTFVDCGMYTGDTIIGFLKFKKQECEIWGFEPDKEIADVARRELSTMQKCKIHIIEKATSDRNGVVKVGESLGIMQTIENSIWGGEIKK